MKSAPDNPPVWRVLLVDDEKDIRDIIGLTLKDAGYEVVSASDGESGAALVESFSPHIVVTDIRMPKLDGLGLLKRIKEARPEIEVVVATAFGDMPTAIRALQLDASDFITKPIDDTALHVAVDRAKNRYSAGKRLSDHAKLLESRQAKTAEELLRSIRFQNDLIESAMDGIFAFAPDGRVLGCNQAACALMGRDRDRLRRATLDDLFSPGRKSDLLEALSSAHFGGAGKLTLFESEMIASGGRCIPVQLSAARLPDDDAGQGVVLFVRDLQQIRRLEREIDDQARILHQDKMMSLGRLAASVVHEINNPIAGVLNYLRLMRRIVGREKKAGTAAADRDETFDSYLALAETETARISGIISNLLAFSRKSEPSQQTIGIADCIHRSALLVRHHLEMERITLSIDIGDDLPPITGNTYQLQQCLINLVLNARDAVRSDGRIEIAATRDHAARAVCISVSDTGPGIPDEVLAHIFEPFFTTKKEGYGVGLGLSTVYGIVQRHGGRIEVDGGSGRGATFRIYLPATSAEARVDLK